jgi:hypothetical protein
MTTSIKRRRGTTAQTAIFTGAVGETTVDTTKQTVVVHDGATAGGFPLATETGLALKSNSASPTFTGTVSGITAAMVGAPSGSGASSGTNTGDQTNIPGNAGTATTAANQSGGTVSATSIAYSTTLTGGTGVVNLGSGQVYKDAVGNVGIGTSSPGLNPTANRRYLTITGTGESGNLQLANSISASNNNGNIEWHDVGNTSSTGTRNCFITSGSSGTAANNKGGFIAFGTKSDGVANAADERARIDASGNVGIGTSSPSFRLDVASDESAVPLNLRGRPSDSIAVLRFSTAANVETAAIDVRPGSAMQFSVGSVRTERMRIDTSGNLLVGYTAKGGTSLNSIVSANAYAVKAGAGAALGGNVFNINWTGSAQLWIDNTNTGTISVTSDYRIKQKIETQTAPALARVMQLRPVTYELQDYGTLFKADGVAREGFIAHELQSIIPSAVEGEKDAANQIQSLKLDALVSVLVKAIQEQQDILVSLKSIVDEQAVKIAALEAK